MTCAVNLMTFGSRGVVVWLGLDFDLPAKLMQGTKQIWTGYFSHPETGTDCE
jgi:hypothetical protein